jgi:hypothetical protein
MFYVSITTERLAVCRRGNGKALGFSHFSDEASATISRKTGLSDRLLDTNSVQGFDNPNSRDKKLAVIRFPYPTDQTTFWQIST